MIGLAHAVLSEYQKALDSLNQALLLSRAIGDLTEEAVVLSRTSEVHTLMGEYERSVEYGNQALKHLRSVGHRHMEAWTLLRAGKAHEHLGENQKALECYQQALPLMQSLSGNYYGVVFALNYTGRLYNKMGEPRKALDFLQQSLQLNQSIKGRQEEYEILFELGNAYDLLGDKQQALNAYDKTLVSQRMVGNSTGEAGTLSRLLASCATKAI